MKTVEIVSWQIKFLVVIKISSILKINQKKEFGY